MNDGTVIRSINPSATEVPVRRSVYPPYFSPRAQPKNRRAVIREMERMWASVGRPVSWSDNA